MTFKKLALASAICVMPMAALAVDSLDDSMLGGVTGQDGIQVTLDLALNGVSMNVHDLDGLNNADGNLAAIFDNVTGDYALAGGTVGGNPGAFEGAGAIVITGMNVNATGVVARIDAGDSAALSTAPVLNINVNLANGVTLDTGSIAVANSARDSAAVTWGLDGLATANLIDSTTVSLGATQLNIQLGNEPQGHMILLDTNVTSGLNLSGFAMYDRGAVAATSGGAIGAGNIHVSDAAGAAAGVDLTGVQVGIDVDEADGLVVDVLSMGNGGMKVRVERVFLGDAGLGHIGDIEMNGVNLAGTKLYLTGN